MKKSFLLSVFLAVAVCVIAQAPRREIRKNLRLSASNLLAYPGPRQHTLTPPPEGMRPFYISHYGRHGSRYHTRPSIYNAPYYVLTDADKAGQLTPLGRDVMQRLDRIRRDAYRQWGELTDLGAEQHRQIITRMYERFPEVFADSAAIVAYSTPVIRCVLSMENAMLRLLQLAPGIQLKHDASQQNASTLNYQDRGLMALRMDSTAKSAYTAYMQKTLRADRLMRSLFRDQQWVSEKVNVSQFCEDLFRVASILQNSDIATKETLYDIYTDDEIYRNWKISNVWWYLSYASTPVNGHLQPYTQRRLLNNIINDADAAISRQGTGANLRYGHETALLPLCCLLDINGCGLSTTKLTRLDKMGWVNYRIFPMGGNLQFVFYRRSPSDTDVMFKVLLNENEATLPLKSSMAPYYRWADFKEYCKRILDEYPNLRKQKK